MSADRVSACRYAFGVTNQNVTLVDTTAASTFTFTASASANGTISPFGTQVVSAGSNLTVIITPNSGYHVADVLVDGVSVGAVTSYTFTNVAANHTIAATFAANFAATMTVNSADFSNPIAYAIKSLLTTKMSFNANMSGVHAKLVVHIPAYKLKPAADWTVYDGSCVNTADANFTLPAWNGKNPANGAVAPYAANFGWTLTITKAGQTTVTKTGSILLSTIYFKRVGSSAAGAPHLHVGYLQGPPYASGGVNIYVSATTTAPSDRLAIRVTGPAGSGYAAVPTNSPWTLPGTGLPTGRLTGTTAIRANGYYNFNVTGTTNVSYTISVIE